MIDLRPPKDTDADLLYPLLIDTTVTETIAWDGPESLEEYRQGIKDRAVQVAEGRSHFFIIVERTSDRPIGSCSVRPEEGGFRGNLGLWLGEPYQGKGYGTAVIRMLMDYGFETLGLGRIEAQVFVGNWASRRVFEKNGFGVVGIERAAVEKRGVWVDAWKLAVERNTSTV
ncbi:MAG: GNAT family N-acetyltransferase [Anaerolineales bacterium]|jgi:RimJ/RimL family protein N-acetyltransferase